MEAEILTFRAIADPARRSILDLLAEGECAATELLAEFSFSQPALSRHLKVLLGAGLVSRRTAGRSRIYRLEPLALKRVHDWVAHYERFWHERLERLGDVLNELESAEDPA